MLTYRPIDIMSASGLPSDISKIAGPALFTHLFQWGLFGVHSVQVYNYHLAFPKDPLSRKILVYAVYTAGLTQTILYTQMAFKVFAAGFGGPTSLSEVGNFWFSGPIMCSTMGFTVQLFYAYRIKTLAKSFFIPTVVFLLALVQLSGALADAVVIHLLNPFSKNLSGKVTTLTVLGGVWNAGSAVCDIVIAISMTYYLSRLKTVFKPIQRIVQRLIFLVIGTGSLTAAVAAITFILYMLPGHPAYCKTASGILGEVYATTMMVVINSRIVFYAQDDSVKPMNEPLLSSASESNPGVPQRPPLTASHGTISVTREQWTAPSHGTKGLEAKSDNAYAASEV